MHDSAIPVKVFEDLVRHIVKWMEANRPLGADRQRTTQWVLSAAFSSVVVAGSACASIGALGAEISEEEFLDVAREAFRRARRTPSGATATA